MQGLQIIKKGEHILAIIIRDKIKQGTLLFPCPREFPLQVGSHKQKKNVDLKAHKHKTIKKANLDIQEVFFIKKGKIKVTLYDKNDKKYKDAILKKGDVLLLNCGHALKFLENTEMIEVKQGPYRGKKEDKVYI